MVVVAHRVNTIAALNALPREYGVEIDLRHDNRTGRIYLHHDPGTGDDFAAYLDAYRHAFMILNIKESGIEDRVLEMVAQRGIPQSDHFLLDVEFPYIYYASRRGVRQIAMRYSEDEPLEQALLYKDKVDWCFIDTNTRLPLDERTVEQLRGFRTCLVCPERWGRPQDIPAYAQRMRGLGFQLDAVMTAPQYATLWERSGALK